MQKESVPLFAFWAVKKSAPTFFYKMLLENTSKRQLSPPLRSRDLKYYLVSFVEGYATNRKFRIFLIPYILQSVFLYRIPVLYAYSNHNKSFWYVVHCISFL